MESELCSSAQRPYPNTFGSNLFPSHGTPYEAALGPRLRRYLHEIGDVLTRIVHNTEDTCADKCDDELLSSVEQHISTQGVRRQILQLEANIVALHTENAQLHNKAEEAACVGHLREQLNATACECERLKSALTKAEEDMKGHLKDHTTKYDALSDLFQNLTDKSKDTLLLCDKYREDVERLEQEKSSLEKRITTLESDRENTQEEFTKVHQKNLAHIQELQQQVTSIEKTYLTHKTQTQQATQQLQKQHTDVVEKKTQDIEALQTTIQQLRASMHQSSIQQKQVETFLKTKEALETQVDELRHSQQQCALLQERLQNAEASCAAMKKRFKQAIKQHHTSAEAEIERLNNEILQWKDAARTAHPDLPQDVTPSLLKTFFFTFHQDRSKQRGSVVHLKEENLGLNSGLNSTKDEVHRLQLELDEHKVRLRSVEYEAAVLMGEVQTNKEPRSSLNDPSTSVFQHADTTPPDAHNVMTLEDLKNMSSDQSLCYCHRDKIVQLIEHMTNERLSFSKVLSDYKTRMHSLIEDKDSVLQKTKVTLSNFSRIEQMLEQANQEIAEYKAVMGEQKKLIARMKSAEPLHRYDDSHVLQREKKEALELCDMTREFYRNEAITFRAIIKALLGWHIQIDSDPVGKDIIVTLRPALAKQYNDDAALVFHVKPKQLVLHHTENTPKDVVEEDVYTMFSDEDFDMHLDGRFADKWDTDADWKNQLSARCSYAAFLAITILTEQNQLLHCSAFLAAKEIEKMQCNQDLQQPT